MIRSSGLDRWACVVVPLVLSASSLVGCGGDASPTSPTRSNAAYSLTITPRDTTIVVGDTVQFTATVRDARGNAIADDFAWSWSDCNLLEFIAEVDPRGEKVLLQGKAPGEVKVYATSQTITMAGRDHMSGETTLSITALPGQPVADVTCE